MARKASSRLAAEMRRMTSRLDVGIRRLGMSVCAPKDAGKVVCVVVTHSWSEGDGRRSLVESEVLLGRLL